MSFDSFAESNVEDVSAVSMMVVWLIFDLLFNFNNIEMKFSNKLKSGEIIRI